MISCIFFPSHVSKVLSALPYFPNKLCWTITDIHIIFTSLNYSSSNIESLAGMLTQRFTSTELPGGVIVWHSALQSPYKAAILEVCEYISQWNIWLLWFVNNWEKKRKAKLKHWKSASLRTIKWLKWNK